MRWIGAAVLALVGGCLNPGSTVCADGTVCPAGKQCTATPGVCGDVSSSGDAGPDAPPDAVCEGKQPFEACADAGDFVCVGGQCMACTVDIASCPTPEGFVRMTSPVGSKLNAIDGTLVTNLYAVGDANTIVNYDGSEWSSVDSSLAGNLVDVSVFGDDLAVASNTNNQLARRVVGTWSQESVGQGGTSVWGTSADNVWAVGRLRGIYRYQAAWTNVNAPTAMTDPYYVVRGTSPDAIYAAGSKTLRHINGGVQSIRDMDNEAIYDIWLSGGQAFFVGALNGAGAVWSTSTGSVNIDTPVQMFSAVPTAVWGTANDLYVSDIVGAVHHFNGTGWSDIDVASPTPIRGMIGVPVVNGYAVFAVGDGGAIWRYYRP
jgi:hypothetical protein